MSSTDNNTSVSIEEITTELKALSFEQLVSLQVILATLVKTEAKKATKPAKREKDASTPRRPLHPKMKAWQVFVNFLVASKPDLFIGVKHTDKQKVTKKYREDNEEEYQAFVEDYIATPDKYSEYQPKGKPVSTSNVNDSEEKPKKVKKVKAKPEPEIKPEPEVKPEEIVTAPVEKPVKAKKAKKEADVDKAENPKKTTTKAKKAAKADPVETPANTMWVKFEEEGVTYYRNSNNNSVFTIMDDDDSPGEFIGKYNLTTKSIDYDA
jgi:hypothetical protein